MFFFDNASTTKAFDEVAERVCYMMNSAYFNPSALYGDGLAVKNLIEDSRRVIADKLSVQKNEIYFTSCATESNNWVINSILKGKKGNIVISQGEHASVYECAARLKGLNCDVRFAALNPDSTVNADDLIEKIDENTMLVSLIHCSNETGTVNDIASLSRLIRARNSSTLIHCDGVQAFCKLNTNLLHFDVDFYTMSAHKIGGPKGIGALYINSKRKLQPLFFGGGQEGGARSGTENTAGIAGFAEAVRCFERYYNPQKIRSIFDFITKNLTHNGWIFNGSTDNNSGFIMSFSFDGIRAEVLQHMLSDEGILIGLGSACSSKSDENRVLNAIGRTKTQIQGNIRVSISVNTTIEQAQILCAKIVENLEKLRKNISDKRK